MSHGTTETMHFTPCASLAALGCYLRQINLFGPVRDTVQIAQKTVRHAPIDKLYDAWIAILAGAHGLVEINTRLRSDPALQMAFGRTACADQSTIQATLNACTTTNVQQLRTALTTIYRQHSRGYRHNYARRYQVLDVDMTGRPCGRTAEQATKGYFAKQRNRRGRQLGRVLASHYGEIVTDQVFAGTTQLTRALVPLVEEAERVLDLDAATRRRTILRVDAGGGSQNDVNWALERGYQVHTKDISRQRSRILGASVTEWIDDPEIAGRQVGWVTTPSTEYVGTIRRIAVRWRKRNGQWEYAVILSTLIANDVIALTGQPPERVFDHAAVTLAYARFYDARGGGVETAIKEDTQGLGGATRNKKRFAAQEMVVLLGTLAHNVLRWARDWLADHEPKVRRYGMKRLVRDVLHISGFLVCNAHGRIVRIVLNQAALLVRGLSRSMDVLLRRSHIAVDWGKT